MSHKSQEAVLEILNSATKKVKMGGVYSHYKNPLKKYTVTDLVIIEANDEVAVIYQANYGERFKFMRPLDNFVENVQKDGKIVPRFKLAQ